jgi:hypothetical protein
MMAIASDIGARIEKNSLHVIRPADELAPHRKECRQQSGDMRSGHTGSALDSIQALCAAEPGVHRRNALTRRDHVGFTTAIGRRSP